MQKPKKNDTNYEKVMRYADTDALKELAYDFYTDFGHDAPGVLWKLLCLSIASPELNDDPVERANLMYKYEQLVSVLDGVSGVVLAARHELVTPA